MKGDGREFKVIGLVEVLWKTNTGIINQRLTLDTGYHNMLHKFQAGRGTGNITLEENLIQQVTARRKAVIHEVLLDPQKAYCALDREMCLDILYGYIVGSRTIGILRIYWGRVQMVTRAGDTMALLSRATAG